MSTRVLSICCFSIVGMVKYRYASIRKMPKVKTISYILSVIFFSGPSFSYGIIGSSNFTQKGLLGNAELNYLETDPTRITARPTHGSNPKGHICWFEEKWECSQDWTQEFLEQVIKKSPIYIDIQKMLFKILPPPMSSISNCCKLNLGML